MLLRILGNERGTETERGRRIISTCRLVSLLAFAKPPSETAAAAFARPGGGRDRRSWTHAAAAVYYCFKCNSLAVHAHK